MNMKKMSYGITRNMQMYQNTTQQSINQGYTQHEYLVTQVLYNHTTLCAPKGACNLPIPITLGIQCKL